MVVSERGKGMAILDENDRHLPQSQGAEKVFCRDHRLFGVRRSTQAGMQNPRFCGRGERDIATVRNRTFPFWRPKVGSVRAFPKSDPSSNRRLATAHEI